MRFIGPTTRIPVSTADSRRHGAPAPWLRALAVIAVLVVAGLAAACQSTSPSPSAADYRKALLVDPNYQSALYNLAILDTPTAPQSAILLYQQILAISPKDPNTLYNLGLLLYQSGQVVQGQTMLRQAISLAPSLAAKLPATVKL
jgi:tetratricopeptide (TPR) repeat protein